MKIIISPAKKMVINQDDFEIQGMPVYLKQAQQLLAALRQLTYGRSQASLANQR